MHRDITPYDKSAHLVVVSSENWMVFTEFRQTSPARLILFFKNALWLYVFIPGVFRVAVDNIRVRLDLEIASGVFQDWRVMYFRWRPWPDLPESQMFEYSPDHLAVIYRTDDPHFPLTLWADQRINLVYLLNQSCPAFPVCLFVSLWFKNTGDSIIWSFKEETSRSIPYFVWCKKPCWICYWKTRWLFSRH